MNTKFERFAQGKMKQQLKIQGCAPSNDEGVHGLLRPATLRSRFLAMTEVGNPSPAPLGRPLPQGERFVFALSFLLLFTPPLLARKEVSTLQENKESNLTRVTRQVEESLQKEMGGIPFNIHFDHPSAKRLGVLEEGEFELKDISFNAETKRFRARIVLKQEGQPSFVFGGQVACIGEIAVPLHRMSPGEVIQEKDLAWKESDNASLLQRAANPDHLIGSTPRKPLEPGQVIKAQDIQKPPCVEMGEFLTVVYKQKGLTMTTVVKALESGAKGEMIRVQNPESKKIFLVTIEDKNKGIYAQAAGK